MTNTVDFKAFAIGGAPNVIDQATYAASASGTGTVADGFVSGLAPSNWCNKVWRQATFVAAAIATFISNQLNISVLDDGNLAGFITNFQSALNIATVAKPSRIVTSSATLNLSASSDYAVLLNRTAAVAAMTVNLDAATQVGQEFVLEDNQGNMLANPATLTPPGGHTINGGATFKFVQNFGTVRIRYYGSNIWKAQQA